MPRDPLTDDELHVLATEATPEQLQGVLGRLSPDEQTKVKSFSKDYVRPTAVTSGGVGAELKQYGHELLTGEGPARGEVVDYATRELKGFGNALNPIEQIKGGIRLARHPSQIPTALVEGAKKIASGDPEAVGGLLATPVAGKLGNMAYTGTNKLGTALATSPRAGEVFGAATGTALGYLGLKELGISSPFIGGYIGRAIFSKYPEIAQSLGTALEKLTGGRIKSLEELQTMDPAEIKRLDERFQVALARKDSHALDIMSKLDAQFDHAMAKRNVSFADEQTAAKATAQKATDEATKAESIRLSREKAGATAPKESFTTIQRAKTPEGVEQQTTVYRKPEDASAGGVDSVAQKFQNNQPVQIQGSTYHPGSEPYENMKRQYFGASVGKVRPVGAVRPQGAPQPPTVTALTDEAGRPLGGPTTSVGTARPISGPQGVPASAVDPAASERAAAATAANPRVVQAGAVRTSPPAKSVPTETSVPFMITKQMEKDLRTAGYSQADINQMDPEGAHIRLRQWNEGGVGATAAHDQPVSSNRATDKLHPRHDEFADLSDEINGMRGGAEEIGTQLARKYPDRFRGVTGKDRINLIRSVRGGQHGLLPPDAQADIDAKLAKMGPMEAKRYFAAAPTASASDYIAKQMKLLGLLVDEE